MDKNQQDQLIKKILFHKESKLQANQECGLQKN